LATRLGLDVRRFASLLEDGGTEVESARQRQVCTVAGARGTPTLFVDGDSVQGERGIDELSAIVEAVLELDHGPS
jgi:predicted DsbA family dithiol-disulfide isomerase